MTTSFSRARTRVDDARTRLKAGWRGQRRRQQQEAGASGEAAAAPESAAGNEPTLAASQILTVAEADAFRGVAPSLFAAAQAEVVQAEEKSLAEAVSLSVMTAEAAPLQAAPLEAAPLEAAPAAPVDPVLAQFAPLPEVAPKRAFRSPAALILPLSRTLKGASLPPLPDIEGLLKRPLAKLAKGSARLSRRQVLAGGLAAGAAGLAFGISRQVPLAPRTVATASLEPPIRPAVEALFENEIDYLASNGFPAYPRPEESPAQLAEAAIESRPASPHVAKSLLFAERRLVLYNENTGEGVNALYWADGDYVLEGLEAIQVLLRDHRAGEIAAIDLQLVEALNKLGKTLDAKQPFHILSAYRTRKTNEQLSEIFHGVAVNSFHMKGKAVDIRLPGRSKRDLLRAALDQKSGGVGNYPRYIHFDTGPVRRWSV